MGTDFRSFDALESFRILSIAVMSESSGVSRANASRKGAMETSTPGVSAGFLACSTIYS